MAGYRRRMLAVRSIEGVSSAKLFRLHLFWIFTLFGMTLPYRIWFKRHCDFLRVTVVKETSVSTSGSYWTAARRWFPSPATMQSHASGDSNFRSFMQGQSLYTKEAASRLKIENSPSVVEEGTSLSTDSMANADTAGADCNT